MYFFIFLQLFVIITLTFGYIGPIARPWPKGPDREYRDRPR